MIPFSEVISRIRKLADEHPDRVVGCDYFNEDGTPCCIVGNVISELGAVPGPSRGEVVSPTGERVVGEGKSASSINWNVVGVENPTSKQIDWVISVQETQDERNTWSVAVDR